MEGIEGHHGTIQVQGFQQRREMTGLVVPDIDLEVVQEVPAVFSDAEKADPGAAGAAGADATDRPDPAAACCLAPSEPLAYRRVSHVGTVHSVTMRDRDCRQRVVRDAATARLR
jgi:hypothetical protein